MPDTARPQSVDELVELMRTGEATGDIVRFRGGATKWTWGGPAAEPAAVVDLSALDGVVEHAAGDLVVTVRAGTRLAAVQDVVGRAGQWLALDPPEPDATVGGVVATAVSGPHRLRYGTPRDLLIGITVVLADGTVARAGGKVVKNVAGYDLGKLFTGSFGTLGAIVECTFRLHPVAKARRVVAIADDAPADLLLALGRSPLEPVAVEWDGTTVHVVFESVEAAADAQAQALLALAGAGEVSEAVPPNFGARPWRDGDIAVKVTHRLSALAAVTSAVRRRLPGARITAHAGSGVAWAGWSAAAPEAVAAIAALRADVAAHDGSVVVVDAPPDVKAATDVWGPVRGHDVMRRVKQQFDPQRRLAPGVFVGGI
jgi:glycolate oxidase FAD binding subunit